MTSLHDIKENYVEMYQKWSALSDEGFYHG